MLENQACEVTAHSQREAWRCEKGQGAVKMRLEKQNLREEMGMPESLECPDAWLPLQKLPTELVQADETETTVL